MLLNVNPNRMELLRLKKRATLARRGHKLLKDKQEQLMRRFLERIGDARQLRRLVERELSSAYREYISARCLMDRDALTLAVSYPAAAASVKTRLENVLNLKMPFFEIERRPEPFTYGFSDTSGSLDAFVKRSLKLLPEMVKMGQLEHQVKMLAAEIESTRRRVNALEYKMIPNIEETVSNIEMKLEEFERGNLTRLMRVKEIMGKK